MNWTQNSRGGGGEGGGVTFYISDYGNVRHFSALPLYDKVWFSTSNYANSPSFHFPIISIAHLIYNLGVV